jgi:hypothetical protein
MAAGVRPAAAVAHGREERARREKEKRERRKKDSHGLNFSPVVPTELARLVDTR